MKMRRLSPSYLRHVVFTPSESRLCLAVSFVYDYSIFGISSAGRAHEPVQLLARLFLRPPSSVIAKIANLDGSRPHGARWDLAVGMTLSDRSEEHTSELQSRGHLVCRLLLEKKK